MRVALLSLCLLAFAVRAYGLDTQSLWRDEVDALRFASRDLRGLLETFTRPGENGPLYYLLLRPWMELAGYSEYALRFFSVIPGVLSVPLLWHIARRLLGTQVAWGAALFFACMPYQIWYSQEAKMYALLVSLVLASALAFLRALERGGAVLWALYLALTSISIYTHVLAVLLIPLHALWFLLLQPQPRGRWLGFGLALAGLTLPYVPLVWWKWTLFFDPTFRTGHPFVNLDTMLTVLLLAHSRGVHDTLPPLVLLPFVFLGLAGILLGQPEPSAQNLLPRSRALLLTWLLLPPLLLFGITLVQPLFTDRYLIWIGPAFALLLARGWFVAWQRFPPLGALLLVTVVLLNLQATWSQTHTPIKADFRAAATYVESRRAAGAPILFHIPYVRHNYFYYAGRRMPIVEGLYTNAGMSQEQADTELSVRLRGYENVWVVFSETGMWDERGLVAQWLEDHGQLLDQARFRHIEVRHYALEMTTAQ